jgi:FMN reductase
MAAVERQGGRTRLFAGKDIDLPMYAPHELERTPKAAELVGALREADAVVVASPGYHGSVSGLIKNALDYFEDLREDPRVYLDNTPFGCITCAYGWQAAVGTLTHLRSIGHALRAWPTPLGVAINSADRIFDETGELVDEPVKNQLEMLATQVITFTCSSGGTA